MPNLANLSLQNNRRETREEKEIQFVSSNLPQTPFDRGRRLHNGIIGGFTRNATGINVSLGVIANGESKHNTEEKERYVSRDPIAIR